MFEDAAGQDPAGFLAAVTQVLAKLPGELLRTGNDGLGALAAVTPGDEKGSGVS